MCVHVLVDSLGLPVIYYVFPQVETISDLFLFDVGITRVKTVINGG